MGFIGVSILLGILSATAAAGKIGFLFTAPRVLLDDYNENVCITFHNQSTTFRVNVTILGYSDYMLSSAEEEVSPADHGGKCFKILLPAYGMKYVRLQLKIQSKTDEDLRVNYTQEVFKQSDSFMTFIFTDKPVYRSGNLVRFRILTLRSDLTPVLEPVRNIWIVNPHPSYVTHWRNVSSDQGLISKTFQLSEEPLPGKWSVKVENQNGDYVEQSFLVKDDILPKFSVTVRSPDYIELPTTNVTVCARYPLGEPVQGDLVLDYSVNCSLLFYCGEHGRGTTRKLLRLGADGCVMEEISLTDVADFVQALNVNATVFELGTRSKATAYSKISVRTPSKKSQPEFSTVTKRRKFKPGLPFRGQVVVESESEPDQKVLICLAANEEVTCKTVSVSEKLTDFLLLPVQVKNETTFEAFIDLRTLQEETHSRDKTKLDLVPWYSPSGSYLQLENPSEAPFRCGERKKLSVLFTSPDPPSSLRFHYMVRSRGIIVQRGILDEFSVNSKMPEYGENITTINSGDLSNVMQFEFFIDVTHEMGPRSSIVVFFIRSRGEVVADSLTLKVGNCLPNQVSTNWMSKVSLPGSENHFHIETSPNSLCALSVTDRSENLLVDYNPFDEKQVFERLENFEQAEPDRVVDSCKKGSEVVSKTDGDDSREPSSKFFDSLQAFNDFGALVITDLDLVSRPCKKRTPGTPDESETKSFDDKVENVSTFNAAGLADGSDARESPLIQEARSFFSETWIWDLVPINNSGVADLSFEVPRGPTKTRNFTEWTGETFCLSRDKGLAISKPSKFVTYQPFFLDFTVPRSLKQKEVFHFPVTVFNFEETDLPVKVTLDPTESFVSKSEESRSFCVPTKSKIVHRFVLESLKLGEAEIKVKAEIDTELTGTCGNVTEGRSDVVVKKTTVKHEGFPVEESKSAFICGSNSNFNHQESWNVTIPPDVVEGSTSVRALVSGDILGPSLQNIDRLITLPTGSAEPSMAVLVLNMLLLDYMAATNSEEPELKERALRNLALGYQKQLKYSSDPGGISAFGNQEKEGSIWLTAFVLRYLKPIANYIYMDQTDRAKPIWWLDDKRFGNGCYPIVGDAYEKKLQGRTPEFSSKILTAYTVISYSVEHPFFGPEYSVDCLNSTNESLGVYGDMLRTCALALVQDDPDSPFPMDKILEKAKRADGMLWWESDGAIASSIEITAYGILSLLKTGIPGHVEAASQAVKWLIQYYNKNGGFISSQDTVLAVEAISKFAELLPRPDANDTLSVNLHFLDQTHVFNISDVNRLTQQEIELPNQQTDVRFESVGKGCALVQTSMTYNVLREEPDENLKIELTINSVSETDSHSISKIQICVKCNSPEDNVIMAILEFTMISGYSPDLSSLYEIRTPGEVVRRWEEFEDKIIFYFEDLNVNESCVNFLVTREVYVENPAPAVVKLYDYYNPRRYTTLIYNLTRESQNETQTEPPLEETKRESKRDIRFQSEQQKKAFYSDDFQGFVNFDEDLDTPRDKGGVFPVFALPPREGAANGGRHCAHCPTEIPEVFSKLYCSSELAVKVLILSKEAFEFHMDLSPHKNVTHMRRTVPFTTKPNCDCPILSSVDSYALLLVTPPRSFSVHHVQELHFDDSLQLYPWGDPNEIPDYLADAINYCEKWPLNADY